MAGIVPPRAPATLRESVQPKPPPGRSVLQLIEDANGRFNKARWAWENKHQEGANVELAYVELLKFASIIQVVLMDQEYYAIKHRVESGNGSNPRENSVYHELKQNVSKANQFKEDCTELLNQRIDAWNLQHPNSPVLSNSPSTNSVSSEWQLPNGHSKPKDTPSSIKSATDPTEMLRTRMANLRANHDNIKIPPQKPPKPLSLSNSPISSVHQSLPPSPNHSPLNLSPNHTSQSKGPEPTSSDIDAFNKKYPAVDDNSSKPQSNGHAPIPNSLRRPMAIDVSQANVYDPTDAVPESPPSALQVLSTMRPPSQRSTIEFPMPYLSELNPGALFQYLAAQRDQGTGPRVLLLDLRSRSEYEHGHILGESVCLEPISIRPGIRASDIEDSLSISPPIEQARFAARGNYDLVVMYDASSTALPSSPPPSSEPPAHQTLWLVYNAIFQSSCEKFLRRQPVLVVGGFEGWKKYLGEKGVGLDGKSDYGKKRENRGAVFLQGTMFQRPGMPQSPSSTWNPLDSTGVTMPVDNTLMYSGLKPGQVIHRPPPIGLKSPRLPPMAAQKQGPQSYGDYSSVAHSYPQPEINGVRSLNSLSQSQGYSSGVTQPYLPTSYINGSITYPELRGNSSSVLLSRLNDVPAAEKHTMPMPSTYIHPSHIPYNPPPPPIPAPITRPPAIQPAPERSSSFSNPLPVPSYYLSSAGMKTLSTGRFGSTVGITGLKNMGNTCYMNSTIQCLSAAIPFAKYFKDELYKNDVNRLNPMGTKGQLADAVSILLRALWSQEYLALSPVSFREQIYRFAPQFRGTDQHDAQEFLGFLLDGLHEDVNLVQVKPKPVEMSKERERDLDNLPVQIMSDREWQIYLRRDNSFVVQLFQGQFRNQLKCLTCGMVSTTYNTFMPLSVPIPGGRANPRTPLESCLDAFVREEILDGDDAWHCPRCKIPRRALKKLDLARLPPVLVIHLKRFSFSSPTAVHADKIETQVLFPVSGLDMTRYLPPPLPDPNTGMMPPPKRVSYDLFGVTNHYGTLSSGHYTAYVKSGQEWKNVGDSKVTDTTAANVSGAKNAYILYYALQS